MNYVGLLKWRWNDSTQKTEGKQVLDVQDKTELVIFNTLRYVNTVWPLWQLHKDKSKKQNEYFVLFHSIKILCRN